MAINYNPNIDDLSKLLSNTDKINYWKDRLAAYKANKGLLHKQNITNTNTLFGLIQQKADLGDLYDYIISLPEPDPGQERDTFWNESIQALIDKNEALFANGNFNNIFTIYDLRNGDAGVSFENTENFVRPWKNLSNNDYNICRSDECLAAIQNGTQLQFTSPKSENDALNAIRLIMPMNTRRVEVEDLNRNFWVISSVISGACQFLLGPDGLRDIIEGLITELGELWENMLYLWVAAGLLAAEQQRIEGVHCEVLYIPNNEFQPYKKYDNFGDGWDIDEEYPPFLEKPENNNHNFQKIKKSIQFLKQKYSKYDLCILPCIRYQNYEHNYYYYESYPFLYFYDRAKNIETFKPLSSFYGLQDLEGGGTFYAIKAPLTFGIDLTVPMKEVGPARNARGAGRFFGRYLYGINSEHTKYFFPYSGLYLNYNSRGYLETKDMILESTQNNYKYETELEVKPVLRCVRNGDILNADISFNFYDATERLIFGTKSLVGTVESDQATVINNTGEVIFRTSLEEEVKHRLPIQFTTRNSGDNCYKGELVTDYDYSSYEVGGQIQYDTKGLSIASQGTLLKIGGYFPKTTAIQSLLGIDKGVIMQAPININGPVRETLDSSGKRTGYKCNLTIGAAGTEAGRNSILGYFGNYDVNNILNPIEEESVFMAEQLTKNNDDWTLYYSKLVDSSRVNFNSINTSPNSCGIKGLSAEMSQKYLQYAFTSENSDHLDSNKIHYVLTSIGISSWLGGYEGAAQGYQGYWAQNVLCHYVRYVPIEYLDGTIPEIIIDGYSFSYSVKDGEGVTVGYLDTVVPADKAEGFVGNFLNEILTQNPSGGQDRWRLPQLNASNKPNKTFYRVNAQTTAKILYHYNKETDAVEQIIVTGGSATGYWYVTADELGLPANPTQQEIVDAINAYITGGGVGHTAKEILNDAYSIAGIWNLFDGYNSNISGNKAVYVGGRHRHVLQLYFEYSQNEFVVSNNSYGMSMFREWNKSTWDNYNTPVYVNDGSLGQALPKKGYIFNLANGTLIYESP